MLTVICPPPLAPQMMNPCCRPLLSPPAVCFYRWPCPLLQCTSWLMSRMCWMPRRLLCLWPSSTSCASLSTCCPWSSAVWCRSAHLQHLSHIHSFNLFCYFILQTSGFCCWSLTTILSVFLTVKPQRPKFIPHKSELRAALSVTSAQQMIELN